MDMQRREASMLLIYALVESLENIDTVD